jgi:folate-binding protein YgfZ
MAERWLLVAWIHVEHSECTAMNSDWLKWFSSPAQKPGASLFSDYAQQASALRDGSIISPLSAFSLIRVSGEDAPGFLQGQFSSDVAALDGTHAQYSSYSTAKGRMLASFLLWKIGSEYFLLLSADIAVAIVKRLSIYIMRSKVKAELCSDTVLLGLHGAQAELWLQQQVDTLPATSLALCVTPDAVSVRLPSGALLWLLPGAMAAAIFETLPAELLPIDAEAWSLLDINAGIPWVTLATQEQFVAQMANMDVIGAVSFTKGCYPGQEIIARTHYLGKVKRRMSLVRLPSPANNGAPLYSPALGEQTIGMLVNVARNAEGHYLALAVAQSACWSDGVYLEKENIHQLEKLSLPYAISDE